MRGSWYVAEVFHLVYCSTAVSLLDAEQLNSLLVQSRDRNAREGVTGLLLYHEGGFVQVLEGAEENVRAIFGSIQRDPRHHSVTTVLEGPIEHREFCNWSMAFRDLSNSADLPEGFSDFLNTPWSGREFSDRHGACLDLLLRFKQILR